MREELSDPAAALNPQQVATFRERGFLVVDSLGDREECDSLRHMLLTLFERKAGRDEGNHFDMLGTDADDVEPVQPEILRTSSYAPGLRSTKSFYRSLAIARRILGPNAQLAYDSTILKPAESRMPTPWHQDLASRRDPNFEYEQITVWIPLQDTDETSGCMRYMPGSHRGPLLNHRSANDDPRIHAYECVTTDLDLTLASSAPVRAGGAIVHHGRIVHAAHANTSGTDRVALTFTFERPPVPRRGGTQLPWISEKRTARSFRAARWLGRGGIFVHLAREIRMGLLLNPERLKFELTRVRNKIFAKWQKSTKAGPLDRG